MSSLLQEGEATTAHVTSTEKRRMSRGQFEYFVTEFFASRDNTEHSKEFRVSATEFDDFREGRSIDIVYLPRDPTVSATRAMPHTDTWEEQDEKQIYTGRADCFGHIVVDCLRQRG